VEVTIMIPRPIQTLLAVPGLEFLARIALASPYLISAIAKLLDFAEASREMDVVGLHPAPAYALAVIATQLAGSVLFLTWRFCWLGAGVLAVFTALATLLAHPFWTLQGTDRVLQMATFFEHAAIIGGFAAATILINGTKRTA
jgi:transmembrane protein